MKSSLLASLRSLLEKVTFEQRFIEKVTFEENLKRDKAIQLVQRHQNGVRLVCLENGLKETKDEVKGVIGTQIM